ncbi:FkbM family methyltransferase [Tardiphaga sp. 839_C3_N1_4]|jgi:FkbM family methyltransferase|uniref:FkbM family methyltransferase n=1 Tax=Tardiphaga sp. 839_C3_N1_4 TaxID=3240761 RepID=UPI003F2696A3
MGNLADLYHLSRFANRHPLARENKRRTFLRFMRWQVASRAIQQPIVLPFVGESRLIISKQMPGAAVNYYFGLPEVEEVSLALHFLREGDLLGDVGANIGALSIAASSVAKARVIAMEPVPSTFKALRDNVAINEVSNLVTTLNMGAGKEASDLNFSTDRGGNDRIVLDGSGLSIPVRALDEVFPETPNMLVIDVEGFEPAVIAGAKRILADPKLEIIIVETLGLASDYNLDDRAMHETILRNGFVTAKYDGFTRVLEPTMGMDKFNTIYVRDVARVSEKVRKANAFRVGDRLI